MAGCLFPSSSKHLFQPQFKRLFLLGVRQGSRAPKGYRLQRFLPSPAHHGHAALSRNAHTPGAGVERARPAPRARAACRQVSEGPRQLSRVGRSHIIVLFLFQFSPPNFLRTSSRTSSLVNFSNRHERPFFVQRFASFSIISSLIVDAFYQVS